MKMTKATSYLSLNHKYLDEAKSLLEKGDYVQASEKFWGAAATKVKCIAATRGVNIKSHGALYRFVSRLEDELNDPQLTRLFAAAASLHQNFYENWLPPEVVIKYGDAVKALVDRLDEIQKHEGEAPSA
jgi:uncharacterized protein (UPF0332 family)